MYGLPGTGMSGKLYIYVLYPTEFVVFCTVIITKLLCGLTENGTVMPALLFLLVEKGVFEVLYCETCTSYLVQKCDTCTRIAMIPMY